MNVGEIKYYSHSSKTKCVFVDNKELPLICIDIWCKAGSSFEKKDKNGSAHLLEHMIFKGSNKIMPGEFDYKKNFKIFSYFKVRPSDYQRS